MAALLLFLHALLLASAVKLDISPVLVAEKDVNLTESLPDEGEATVLTMEEQERVGEYERVMSEIEIEISQSVARSSSIPDASLIPLEDLPSNFRKGKLAYIFLLQDHLKFVPVWKRYFELLPKDSWRAYIHLSKDFFDETWDKMEKQIPFEHTMVQNEIGFWCKLVPSMIQTLKVSIKVH